jgi:hypothetical protein
VLHVVQDVATVIASTMLAQPGQADSGEGGIARSRVMSLQLIKRVEKRDRLILLLFPFRLICLSLVCVLLCVKGGKVYTHGRSFYICFECVFLFYLAGRTTAVGVIFYST